MQSKRESETTTEISSERQRDKQQHMLAPPSFLLPLNSCCCCQTSPRSLDGADKTSSQWSLLVLQPFEKQVPTRALCCCAVAFRSVTALLQLHLPMLPLLLMLLGIWLWNATKAAALRARALLSFSANVNVDVAYTWVRSQKRHLWCNGMSFAFACKWLCVCMSIPVPFKQSLNASEKKVAKLIEYKFATHTHTHILAHCILILNSVENVSRKTEVFHCAAQEKR